MFAELLAGCLTFHRAQSITWKHRLRICLDSQFGEDADKSQQLYVALSRATRLENIELYGTLSRDALRPSPQSVAELVRQRRHVVNLDVDFPCKSERGSMEHRMWISNRKPYCPMDAVRAGEKSVIIRYIGYPLRGTSLRAKDVREGDTVVLTTSGRCEDVKVIVLRVTTYTHATAAIANETPIQAVGAACTQHSRALSWFKDVTHYIGGQVVAWQVELVDENAQHALAATPAQAEVQQAVQLPTPPLAVNGQGGTSLPSAGPAAADGVIAAPTALASGFMLPPATPSLPASSPAHQPTPEQPAIRTGTSPRGPMLPPATPLVVQHSTALVSGSMLPPATPSLPSSSPTHQPMPEQPAIRTETSPHGPMLPPATPLVQHSTATTDQSPHAATPAQPSLLHGASPYARDQQTPATQPSSQASSISPAWSEVADRSQVATVHSQQLRCSTPSSLRPRVASQARPAVPASTSPRRSCRDVSADTPPRVPGQKSLRSRRIGQLTPSSTHTQKKKERGASRADAPMRYGMPPAINFDENE